MYSAGPPPVTPALCLVPHARDDDFVCDQIVIVLVPTSDTTGCPLDRGKVWGGIAAHEAAHLQEAARCHSLLHDMCKAPRPPAQHPPRRDCARGAKNGGSAHADSGLLRSTPHRASGHPRTVRPGGINRLHNQDIARLRKRHEGFPEPSLETDGWLLHPQQSSLYSHYQLLLVPSWRPGVLTTVFLCSLCCGVRALRVVDEKAFSP